MGYIIATDTSCELPWDYLEQHNIPYINFPVTLDGEPFPDDKTTSLHDFFEQMRKGAAANTSQITTNRFVSFFEPYAKEGTPLIYSGLSHGLSATYESACLAKEELVKQYPQAKLHIVKSTTASLGTGLFIDILRRKRDSGMSFENICVFADERISHIHQRFTVDDLIYLHRGGRISRTSVVVGSILGIKPVMHTTPEGKLVPHGKTRGRKNSLLSLVNDARELIDGKTIETFAISHGDCIEDAQFVVEEMKKHFTVENVILNSLGPTIGSHSGPGTVALFFDGVLRTV